MASITKHYGKGPDSDATDPMVVDDGEQQLFTGHGEGEADVANALRVPSHGASWQGGSSDTFVVGSADVAHALTDQKRIAHADTQDYVVAAPLTRGSATGEGVNEPGRRQEDDVNLVTYNVVPEGGQGADLRASESQVSLALSSVNGQEHDRVTLAATAASVRRLTPTECERLQAFPDGWTQLGNTPDSRRYAALGDAVTVSVAHWIGRRIAEVEAR